MPAVEPRLLFAVLGTAFLLLGAVRARRARGLPPQSRAWLLIGLIFIAVASWLQFYGR